MDKPIPEAVAWPFSILEAGNWREVYMGTKHMRLEVSYPYEAWERLMAALTAAQQQQGQAVALPKLKRTHPSYSREEVQWVFGYNAALDDVMRLNKNTALAQQPAPPSAPAGVEEMARLLEQIRDLLESLPMDCLGIGTGASGQTYPIRDEVIHGIAKALSQQPAVGEEIMVNAAHDVFTLPLQPSGLSSGPRFVVHVPGPEQPAAVDEAMVFRLAVWMAKQDGHDDPHHLIWEGSPPVPWGEIWMRYEDDARSALTAALAAQHQEPKS